MVRLFEEQCRATPDARAVVCGSVELTYLQLNEDVNRMGNYLLSRGVKEGNSVGICLERSAEMLIALLATLKIGATYVPLDPNFPRERLEFMASDAGLTCIVVHRQTERTIATPILKLPIDRDHREIKTSPNQNFAREPNTGSTAYVLYTSGSTGKPKGVQIPHRALVNLLWSMRTEPGIQASDVLLAITTLSFDIAALELYLPLIGGACVVIAEGSDARDPKCLSRLINRSGATIVQATPIQWRMLLEAGWRSESKIKILCGGEPLRPQLAADLLAHGELWNMYGPTETTVWSSLARIDSASQPITVGCPIANTRFYILDEARREVAGGNKGELAIGGDGVADGYLNRPELTSERFVMHRSSDAGDQRVYLTGDVARIREDGRTEIFGRLDGQVKVRGFRIELGELEAVLARCRVVRENAVVVRDEPSGEAALAAFFVPSPDCADPVAEVRRYLLNSLPDYMMPGHVVALDRMPQLPNGKIDRKALPSLSAALPRPAVRAAAKGHDEVENKLLAIWESVLGIPGITRDSNFFELGGRSLLAARMFAQIERQLGESLPLAILFRSPTVAALAAVIRDKNRWRPWDSLVPIHSGGSNLPIFFVHAIGGNIINFHAFAARFNSDQPIYGLQARGLDGKESPHSSVEDMAADYIRSIRSVQPQGPYQLGGFSAGGVVAFEMARQLLQAGEETALLALLDTQIKPPDTSSPQASALNALNRLRTVLAFNVRYAIRTGWRGFLHHKLRNWRMRLHIRATTMGMGSLNSEEAFLVALRKYIPSPFAGDAILFRARNELVKYPDPTFGWGPLILGELRIAEVAGDHDTLLDEPYIGELAQELSGSLTAISMSPISV